jgi:hypothetical protein
MKYREKIPDNLNGDILIEIWNETCKTFKILPIEKLCEYNELNVNELEVFLINQLEEYYKDPSVYTYQVFCGCCFNSHVPKLIFQKDVQ